MIKRTWNNNPGNSKRLYHKDRLLRPSLVGVSKKATIKEEKTEENKENTEKIIMRSTCSFTFKPI